VEQQRVILASGNKGKCEEIQQALSAAGVPLHLIPQFAYQVPEADETEDTFLGNALLKARHACRHTGLPALADDSGLVVDALGGAPGIYSARYAGRGSSNDQKMDKLLAELQGVPDEKRTAHFYCALVYMQSPEDLSPLAFETTWEGRILHQKQGAGGFGYDPIFYVPAHNCSAAQLPINIKNRISHRGQALAQLIAKLMSVS